MSIRAGRGMAVALLGVSITLALAQPKVIGEKFDPARDAAKDIHAAVAEAGASGRRVLLDVGGEWCIWCRRLDTLFVTHPALEEFRKANYVTVKVNWSKENKNEAVLSKYPPIKGYPHLFVLEKDGTVLHSQDTGELEIPKKEEAQKGKGHDPEKVMAFLRRWAPAGR
jgi:thiol:disulfide interchange protein